MHALYIIIPVLCVLAIAYRYYSAFIAARLMALWGLIDLVASMVDDARDAEATSGQVGGIDPAPQNAP